MAEDAQKTWIQEANRLLRENPELTKKEVETLLSKQGKDKPTGIESHGSRSFKKKTRSTGQRQRRKAQEQVSTETASEYTKTQRRLMQEDLGIAEYAGLDKPFFEHKYSQDVSGLLEEGAPGDYVARFPESESSLKTEAERVSRQNFGNKFAIVNTATDLKAVPVEAFSELVDPEDLPGFKIDPDIPLKEQFSAATQVDFKGGGARLNRAALTGLAAAGVAAPGLFGTVASAQEFAGRTQIARETGDPADQFQAGLAGASLGADIASYVPPLAPIGEAVSTAADVANIGIDVYREDPEKAKQMVTQQAKRMIPADPIVTPVQRAAQAVQRGGKVKFGFGGVKFTLPEFGLSELMGLN